MDKHTVIARGRGNKVSLAAAVMAVAMTFALICSFMAPSAAYALAPDLGAAGTEGLTTQASASLATAKKAKVKKTVKKNAKAIVKSAKAKKGKKLAKLNKIYKYIATDAKFGGKFSFPDYGYLYFYKLATSKANKAFYPITQPTNLKNYYKKYAIDAYKTKKASCHHYAALFGVAAKSALGKGATVKIGTRNVLVDGVRDVHSWVEVKIGKTVYVYDTQKGNLHSKDVNKANDFGVFCGSKKADVKSMYNDFKDAKYCTVKL